jgi:hypothetical protein
MVTFQISNRGKNAFQIWNENEMQIRFDIWNICFIQINSFRKYLCIHIMMVPVRWLLLVDSPVVLPKTSSNYQTLKQNNIQLIKFSTIPFFVLVLFTQPLLSEADVVQCAKTQPLLSEADVVQCAKILLVVKSRYFFVWTIVMSIYETDPTLFLCWYIWNSYFQHLPNNYRYMYTLDLNHHHCIDLDLEANAQSSIQVIILTSLHII